MSGHPRQSERGITLLEVLIAIVILFFGVLAVLRIYPLGLDLIEQGSQRTIGVRLADNEIQRWLHHSVALPDFIAAVNPATGAVTPLADPDNLTPDPSQGEIGSPDFRRILRERTVVSNQPYLLAGGPIVPGSDGVTTPYRRVNSFTVTPGTFDQEVFAVDGPSGTLRFDFYSQGDRYFLVDYACAPSPGQRIYLLDQPITVPSGASPATASLGVGNVIPGTVVVRRVFTRVGGAPSAPFQYAVDPNLGEVSFAPMDIGRSVDITYTVRDWSILRDEKEVELINVGGTPVPGVQISVPFVQFDDADGDGRDDAGGVDGNGNPVVVIEVASGLATAPNPATDIDFERGLILLPGLNVGARVRVLYRSSDGWMVQPFKAATQYVPEPSPPLGDPRRYLDRGNGVLEFYPSEAGKAVVVSYTYGRSTPPQLAAGELQVIPLTPPYQIALNYGPVQQILKVEGVSLRVRVSWQVKGTRKKIDVDTYLTRG
ncbi:MAG TPA: hypothetical protein EYP85_14670 [Armatimonadetes bacterium]|nr:hypothetical protein [Armatimonadota bacterium]